jgi:hypothetical protein
MEQGRQNEQKRTLNGGLAIAVEGQVEGQKVEPKPESKMRIRYDVIRPHIKNADVLMFQGKYRSSALIKRLTRSPYSHAGIAVWWNKRLMVMEADSKGVVVSRLSSKLEKYKGKVELYTHKEEISKEDRDRMIDFAQEELGKEYATWKALVFGWKVLFKRKLSERDGLRKENKLFCSQYVAQIYNAGGKDLKKNRDDRFMSPNDIANSDKLKRKGIFLLRKRIFLVTDEGAEIHIE